MARRPLRLRILDKLTAIIEGVTPDEGYETDLRGKVFRGRLAFGDSDPLPMIALIEPPVPPQEIRTQNPNPYLKGDWEILIQGFVRDDMAHPADPAHIMMADVKRAIILAKMEGLLKHAPLGFPQIEKVHISQGTVRPPEVANGMGFFYLSLTIGLTEDLRDPWT